MIPRLLLVLSFTTVLAAQSAPDLSLAINGNREDVTIDVITNVPMRDPYENTLTFTVAGSLEAESWSVGPGLTCEARFSRYFTCAITTSENTFVTLHLREAMNDGTAFIDAWLTWRDRGMRAERRRWRKHLYRYAREWTVTSTDDAGPGSLRQAIEEANAACNYYIRPCRIGFDLAPAATIRPVLPLPRITASDLTIESQWPVQIDGSLLESPANGFELRPVTQATLRGLTINSFPENGVEVIGSGARIESCIITGNRSRGITITGGGAWIEDSVISGNGRSGIFHDAAGPVRILRNKIGVAVDGVTPLPNGASGIFAGRGYDTEIVDNVIAWNGHFGVGTISENRTVDVGRNRIVGNALGEIDIDLDGPSFFTDAIHGYQPPNGPALLSATYDPSTDQTTVAGRLDGVPFFYFLTYEIQFFATTAANGTDDFLGAISLFYGPAFTVSFPGDLRGRFVTANTIRYVHDEITTRGTSELSAPIEVQ